ncbi:uncharacterized protein EV420DRAFT_1651737 [Desarmillaria tabescens]|uniref:Uncharacterized protein n=1 Tax=Armillaria tabescens TaxID=1929756 RepID=A0AA39J997_ARMTA|nr:uncharacterized protein EV420DRAFT_1651737 [Desarmillaria tabescens]KAK0437757.1 hypothetical protein EV420DRAFT_1651737 [Desarmillaria tabescens]
MSINNNSSCPNVALKIIREGAATQSGFPGSQQTSYLSGSQLVATSAMSVEDHCATAGKVIEETAKPIEPSEWISKLIDGVDTVKSVIDALKDLHPAASIACGIVLSCINVLKQQTERDQTVLQLYDAMITTYTEASDDRMLWQQKQLKPIYISLFQITNECGMFIKRYMNKNRFKCLFSLNVSQTAKEFIKGLANLREQLNLGVAKDVLAVTLGVRVCVGIYGVQMLLQALKPKQELGPKSTCMPGTHVETVNALISWIAEGNDSILWCSGLAGTGKSSLVSTLC